MADPPFSCRKAAPDNTFQRELTFAFGASGYVALFEIDDAKTVTVLAVRDQREDDYHWSLRAMPKVRLPSKDLP